MVRLSQLPIGGTITGSEVLCAVQSNVTSRFTLDQLANYIATYASGKLGEIDARDYDGIDFTGEHDSATAWNQFTLDCINEKRKGVSPGGLVRMDAPWLAMLPNGQQATFLFDGPGSSAGPSDNDSWPSFPFPADINNLVIAFTFNDRFGIGFNLARGSRLRGVSLLGQNLAVGEYGIPHANAADYLNGCRDSRYSPYAGIVIDPFNCNTPPDGGYPGMSAQYGHGLADGSYGVLVEDVNVQGFSVNVAYGITPTVSLAADLTFRNVTNNLCKTNYAFGCSQSDNVNIEYGNVTNAHTGFDGMNYGNQQGKPPKIGRPNTGYIYRPVAIHSSFGNVDIELYAESVCSYGIIGANAANESPITVKGEVSIFDGPGWPICPILAEIYGPAKLDKFSLSAGYSGNFDSVNIISPTAPIDWDGGAVGGPSTPYLMPHLGPTLDGSGSCVRFRNGLINGHNGRSKISYSDDRQRSYGISSYEVVAGRIPMSYQGGRLYNGNETLEFQPSQAAQQIGYPNVSSISIDGSGNLLFTCTTPYVVQIGDILGWLMKQQPNSAIQWTTAGFKVSSIIGNNIVAAPINGFDVTQYDTAANYIANVGSIFMYPQHSVMSRKVTCTTNGTANLTAVTPPLACRPGDFIFGSGFASWTRVLANPGDGTMTLNQAATNSATLVQINTGNLNKPTVTAWDYAS